jgi:hypothetical protein
MDEPRDTRRRRVRLRFVVGVIVTLYVALGALFLPAKSARRHLEETIARAKKTTQSFLSAISIRSDPKGEPRRATSSRTAAESVVRQKRWAHIHLTVSTEEFFELLRRGPRGLARRQCRPRSPD